MKHLTLDQLTLTNFKGIRFKVIYFQNRTQINGANGTGKTTVFDAYCWLLYGKNSVNETDFAIKTLDESGNPIHKLEHSVEGRFNYDDRQIVLRREYREKWVTKRGNSNEEMSGHETKFFVDDVPTNKTEYQSKVKEILDESISRMISNPAYFNEKINWKDRRSLLIDMAGDITPEDVALASEHNIDYAIQVLTSGVRIEDEKKKLAAQRLKQKGELKLIPTKIEEVDRMMPENIDFESIDKSITEEKEKLQAIEEKISNEQDYYRKKSESESEKARIKSEKQMKYNRLELENKRDSKSNQYVLNEISEYDKEILTEEIKLSSLRSELGSLKANKGTLESEIQSLRSEYKRVKESSFDYSADQTHCPTCKRKHENADQKIEELQSSFNSDKAEKLEQNEKKGTKAASDIKLCETQIECVEQKISETNTRVESLKEQRGQYKEELNKPQPDPEPNQKMIALKADIDAIVLSDTIEKPDFTELNSKKTEHEKSLRELEKKLQTKETINRLNERKAELNNQKRTISAEIAEIEGKEFQIDAYTKTMVEMVEQRVNSRFTIVKFKMFETQINGGESPTCICIIDGVPYSDLNTASKINAGLDIVNTLQHHYETIAPIFVDQRESVTTLANVSAQVISLKVDETAKELEVLSL